MWGQRANSYQAVSAIFTDLINIGTIVEGQPLCYDVTQVSGGTLPGGGPITEDMGVTNFGTTPSWTNAPYMVGGATVGLSTGDYEPHLFGGPGTALIKNETAIDLDLAVGDPFMVKPGSAFYVPLLGPSSDGTDILVRRCCGRPGGFVREAITIAAGETEAVPAYFWGGQPPRYIPLLIPFAANVAATISNMPIFSPPGPALIERAGMIVGDCGAAGLVEIDLKIGGTTIYTATPKVDNDGVNGVDTLGLLSAPSAAGVGAGTNGRYGTINTAANRMLPQQVLTLDVINAGGTWNGLKLMVQVDLWLL